VILFPNCKINLGLDIIRKRDDGYHELESVFYPLPVRDVLEVITANKTQDAGYGMRDAGDLRFFQSGLPVAADTEDNLCIKAWRLLKNNFTGLPSIELFLHKSIPMGAGLGGGSADAAFTLKLLNEKYRLNITTEKLLDYSLQLGSDCPFFIINKPSLATGRGEFLQAIDLDLSSYSFVLIYPGIHIKTSWAFAQASPSYPAQSIRDSVQQPVERWKEFLKNDFEEPVCKTYPELRTIKDTLYGSGALYASMTGSGSCFYGIYKKNQFPAIQWPVDYTVFHLK
jgi:4-diphosphocytidyl-2-C-methyl-D-erythritol kinase